MGLKLKEVWLIGALDVGLLSEIPHSNNLVLICGNKIPTRCNR
jgi:hypothetical protein